MSAARDQIMYLASEYADAKVAHSKAVVEFANDRAEYAPVPKLAKKVTAAEKALRKAVESAVPAEVK